MTPALRTLAANLLVLYGGLPDSGDGISLDALPLADREAIEALILADPMYDPDGEDTPHPDYGLWPTGLVCRAMAAMLKADDHAGHVDLPDGNQITHQPNEAGGRSYSSAEVGGGVHVWDTALVAAATLVKVIEIEAAQPNPACRLSDLGPWAEATRLRGEVDTLMGAMVTPDQIGSGGWRTAQRYYPTREQAVAEVRTRLGMDGGEGVASC